MKSISARVRHESNGDRVAMKRSRWLARLALRATGAMALIGLTLGLGSQAARADVLPPPTTVCTNSPPPPINTGTTLATPGRWWNPARPGTGWDLFYFNPDPSLPAGTPRTLMAYWYTFDANRRPVWLIAGGQPVDTTTNTWTDSLYRVTWNYATGQRNDPVKVGSVAMSFLAGDPTRAAISWQWNDAGSTTRSECISDFFRIQSPTNGTDPELDASSVIDAIEANTTFSGAWYEPLYSGWGDQITLAQTQDTNPSGYIEVHALGIYDSVGNPAWVQAQSAITAAAPATGVARTIEIHYVSSTFPGGIPVANCPTTSCFEDRGVVGSLTRVFNSVRLGTLNLNVDAPSTQTLTGQSVVWQRPPSGTTPVAIEQLTQWDSILVDRLRCDVVSGQTSCGVTVNWGALNATYRPYRRDLDSNSVTLLQNAATGQRVDAILSGHRIMYELRAGGPTTALIASTPEVRAIDYSAATPPAPDGTTAPAPSAASDAVGAAIGEFRVDESGSATYRVPLFMPAGAGGVAPQLAFQYSSNGAEGALGTGWSVGGLSSITRCRRTTETGDGDGPFPPIQLDDRDAYCLDGQRLLKIPESRVVEEFRTEIDTQQRIRLLNRDAAGFPNEWEVLGKDGTVRRFGGANARVAPTVGGTAKPIAWLQTRSADTIGNGVDVTYSSFGMGELLPTTVTYQGGQVSLSYRARSGNLVDSQFAAGAEIQRTRMLDRIEVFGSYKAPGGSAYVPVKVRTYYPQYGNYPANQNALRERMTGLRECAPGAGGTDVCYPATAFGWLDPDTAAQVSTSVTGTKWFADLTAFKYGDVDGDNRADLVWLDEQTNSGALDIIQLAYSAPNSNGIQFVPYDTAGHGIIANLGRGYSNDRSWQLFDFNGDGRDDLLMAVPSGSDHSVGRWVVRLSNAQPDDNTRRNTNPFGPPLTPTLNGAEITFSETYTESMLTDMNGDGMLDLVTARPALNGRVMQVRYLRRNPNGVSSTTPGGSPLLYAYADPVDLSLEGVSGVPCSVALFSRFNVEHFEVADVNGDGLADLRLRTKPSSCTGLEDSGGYEFAPDRDLSELSSADGEITSTVPPAPDATSDAYWTLFINGGRDTGGLQTFRILRQWKSNGVGATVSDDDDKFRVVDLNGDGLSDVIYKGASVLQWYFELNTGTGFKPATCVYNVGGVCQPIQFGEAVQVLDYDGDGHSDFWQRIGTQNGCDDIANTPDFCFYRVSPWNGNGFASTPIRTDFIARVGGWIRSFADLDGDGFLDNVLLHGFEDDHLNGDWEARRFRGHHLGRNAIERITNGLGAVTEIDYGPLGFTSLYQRDYNAPYHASGRNSTVFDVQAPSYVVQYVASSAPTGTSASQDPSAKSRIQYRYRGMKIQAGGRGSLGFRKVYSLDWQTRIESETTYGQAFPRLGIPLETATRVLGAIPMDACLTGFDSPACITRTPECGPIRDGVCDSIAAGTLLTRLSDEWHYRRYSDATRDPNVAKFGGIALFVFRTRSDASYYDLASGVRTHGETTEFLTTTTASGIACPDGYDSVGDVCRSRVTKLRGANLEFTDSTLDSSFDYAANNLSNWLLGRMTRSVVDTTRTIDGIAVTTHREATFEYLPGSGLLSAEHLQPTGSLNEQLHTYYAFDARGNKIKVATCSGHIDAATCQATTAASLSFHPTDALRIQRYQRFEYDELGRFVDRTYAPFWNGAAGVERLVSQVLARNAGGDPTQVRDGNGVTSDAAYGALGRKYFEKSAAGAWSQVQYTSCASTSCPVGAAFVVQRTGGGAPSSWTYNDVLGRPMIKVGQGFASGQYIAARQIYDNLGRITFGTEPYFALGIGANAVVAVSSSGVYWSQTQYDALGRVVRAYAADGSMTSSAYDGLQTIVTLPANGSGQTQRRTEIKNALGEITRVIDAKGWPMDYVYRPGGELWKVRRAVAGVNYETTINYDNLGRKIGMTDPDMGAWSYEVNAAGETTKQISARGKCSVSAYDAQGRMWNRRDYDQASCSGAAAYESTLTFDTAANGLGKLSTEAGNDGAINAVTRVLAYDAFSRPIRTDSTQEGSTYVQRATYDQFSRPFQSFFKAQSDALSETGEMLEYNAQGFQTGMRDAYPGTAGVYYYRTLEMNARGQVTREERGGNAFLTSTRSYDAVTGRLTSISTDNGRLQSLSYSYDVLGNVMQRTDQTGGRYVREALNYDELQRLTLSTVYNGQGQTVSGMSQIYDGGFGGPGNISSKSNVGSYTYAPSVLPAQCNQAGDVVPGPHAVRQYGQGAVQTVACYDADGNQTRTYNGSSVTRDLTYAAYGLPTRMTNWAGNKRVDFAYGPSRERLRRADFDFATSVSASEVTHFFGNVEIHRFAGLRLEILRNLGAIIVVQKRDASGAIPVLEVRYPLTDNLGSVQAVVTGVASVITNGDMGFDAWGARRSAISGASWTPNQQWAFPTGATTRHGFTGHEQVDALGIIHMNGRIYDPNLGRFLQADPLVQSPYNSQSYNRYTYVFNNPLAFTDPTGYWGAKEQGYLRAVVAIVITVYSGGTAAGAAWGYYGASVTAGQAFAVTVIGGFAAGAVQTGTLKGGLTGAVSAAMFYGVGTYFQGAEWAKGSFVGSGYSAAGWAAKSLTHGIVGGVMSELQGGKFGHGFASAGVSEALSPAVSLANGHSAGNILIAAAIGGTASAASGGKFANGAITSAFGCAFNQLAHTNYTLEAGVSLSATVEAQVGTIADAYNTATGSTIVVTSGTRTADSQADAMYDKFAAGGAAEVNLYKDTASAQKIYDSYSAGVAAKATRATTVSDMSKIISDQIAAGTYISKHLMAGAVDVRSRDMSATQQTAFKTAAQATATSVILETSPPHWHLQF